MCSLLMLSSHCSPLFQVLMTGGCVLNLLTFATHQTPISPPTSLCFLFVFCYFYLESNGVSEQWQPSGISQPVPSSPGDQPHKAAGRMTSQDNSARDRGFQDRQRLLPGQFDTPPGAPISQASTPPHNMPSPPKPAATVTAEHRYQIHEPETEVAAPPPSRITRGGGVAHLQAQQQLFDQVAGVCCWSACRTMCVYCLAWATVPVTSFLNYNKLLSHRDIWKWGKGRGRG